jgi:hypothetical protein
MVKYPGEQRNSSERFLVCLFVIPYNPENDPFGVDLRRFLFTCRELQYSLARVVNLIRSFLFLSRDFTRRNYLSEGVGLFETSIVCLDPFGVESYCNFLSTRICVLCCNVSTHTLWLEVGYTRQDLQFGNAYSRGKCRSCQQWRFVCSRTVRKELLHPPGGQFRSEMRSEMLPAILILIDILILSWYWHRYISAAIGIFIYRNH